MDTQDRFEAQAKDLVSRMTVEERCAQLRFEAPALPRLGIPEYNWWNEGLHGVARAGTATVFPQAIGMAAAFDRGLMYAEGDVVAEEGRAKYNEQAAREDRDIYKGLTFWSPNINIFRDPRWGRGHETLGEDPYLTGELGAAFVKGVQQTNSQGYMKAAACAKHFAVHSGPENIRHEFDAVVSKKDFWETYVSAFEKLVTEAGVEGVMGAYNRVYGEPSCGSPFLLRKILREKWGFNGYTVSDCGAIADFHEHHRVTNDALESAALAMNAGCDLNCGWVYPKLQGAYDRGMIPEERLTEAAEHAMRTRTRLGLFDPDCEYNRIGYDKVCCEEHIALTLKAARESLVLLKNNGILPLKGVKTVGVIGPNADNRVALLGNYHGTPDRYITPLEALYQSGDFRVLYSEGCHLSRANAEEIARENDRISEALTVAAHSDVVLLFLGLDETLEGEEGAGDKADLSLPKPQRILLERLCESGTPVVLVNMTGSAMDLRYAEAHCAAILQAWYPGARGGIAIADVLTGRVSPSGRLPVTFYRSADDLPDFTDYAMADRTYRYFKGEPLYPFGYGLSYADIRVTDARRDGDSVTVTLKNFSDFAAEDVAQVYAKYADPLAPVNGRLCGFERAALAAGETKEVSVALDKYTFTVINEEGERVPCRGEVTLYAGLGQPDARTEALTGKKCVIVK